MVEQLPQSRRLSGSSRVFAIHGIERLVQENREEGPVVEEVGHLLLHRAVDAEVNDAV